MLGKLIKHEFRATGRVMGPLFLALLLASLMGNISINILENADSKLLHMFGVLFITFFAVAMIATGVMAIVIMVRRFRKNLLGDQGYLMFTLPTSTHSLVLSKLIVSLIWFVFTGIAELLAALILTFKAEYINGFVEFFRELFSDITAYYALNGTALLIELIIITLLSCASACLMFYAAMSIGHSFANHKVLLSVVFYFVLYAVSQFIGFTIILNVDVLIDVLDTLLTNMSLTEMGNLHMLIGTVGIGCLIYDGALYALTAIMLKKRLNLS